LQFDATSVDGGIRAQLSQPNDVASAHQFFQASGGETALPNLSFESSLPAGGSTSFSAGNEFLSISDPYSNMSGLGGGAEQALNLSGGGSEAAVGKVASGAESALFKAFGGGAEAALMPTGMEQGALAGIPAGDGAVSPLVQMIMKLPGLTGVMGSFFEALMSFFFPADGGFMNLFNPTVWAECAQQAVGSFATILGGNIPFNITFFGQNSLMQSMMQGNLFDAKAFMGAGSSVDISTVGLEHQPFDAIGANPLEVSGPGSPGKLFETGTLSSDPLAAGGYNVDLDSNKFIAMEGGNSFAPTISNSTSSVNISQDPSAMQSAPALQQSAMPGDATAGSGPLVDAGGDQMGSQMADGAADRGSMLDQQGNADAAVADGAEVAEAPLEPQNYSVVKGDNLWNIAKAHLGDGARWQEIYNLNSDVIGQNPDLIYAGTDLKMPTGAENLASSDYMVKSGDNLWNIARDHMGGGQNWPDIYNQNVGVIGSNPNLIHPGQHLAVPAEGQGMQLAHNNVGTGAAHGPAHPAAHGHGAGHGHGHGQVAHHAKPAHTAHRGDASANHTAHAEGANNHTAHAKGADNHVAHADHGATKTHELAQSTSPADSHAQEYGTPGAQEVAESAAATKEQIGLKAVAKSL